MSHTDSEFAVGRMAAATVLDSRHQQIMALMRHASGASITELMALTRCTATQARYAIRQIIDAGSEVESALRPDGQQVFRIAPHSEPRSSRTTEWARQITKGEI